MKININFILIVISVTLLDLVTKYIFREKYIKIIPNIFEISYSSNPGLIFGLFKYNIFFTILLPLIVIGIIIYYFYKNELEIYGSSLIAAGILGNLIERIMSGTVTDWIFVMIYPKLNISLFNLADTSLVIGIILSIYFLYKKN